MLLRPPDAQQVMTGLSFFILLRLAPRLLNGMLTEFLRWSFAYSAGVRTSITCAPSRINFPKSALGANLSSRLM